MAKKDIRNTGSFSKPGPGPSPALLSPSIVWAAKKYLTYRIVLRTGVIPHSLKQGALKSSDTTLTWENRNFPVSWRGEKYLSLRGVWELSTKRSTGPELGDNQECTKFPLKPQVSVVLDPATLTQQKSATWTYKGKNDKYVYFYTPYLQGPWGTWGAAVN